jgi:hypothetical protein
MYKHNIKILLICFLLHTSLSTFSQTNNALKTQTITSNSTENNRKYTIWSIKAGANISVIYLARNVKDNNNEPGNSAGINFEINNFVRISTLYSRFRPINIEPTWLNVKANTYESNLEVVAKFPNKKTLIYPFVGFSYNTYTGFFTGKSDYLNLKEYYPVNSTIKNKWLGFNLGTGLEHNFGIIGLFIDYRMRVGRQENGLNIMDVCYTTGVKIRFPYGKLATKLEKRISNPNDKFHWF